MTSEVRIDKSRATDYETIFILRADIDAETSERVISRAVAAIEQTGGKLLKLESWGKRRLAYPIGKQRKGFYVYSRYLGYQGTVAELERNLRMLDTVLRHMSVQLRKNVDSTAVTVDPEEIKVRRIEITEGEEDREDSVEASLGLADDQRRERRERPEPEAEAEGEGEGEGGAPAARGARGSEEEGAHEARPPRGPRGGAGASAGAAGEKPAAEKPAGDKSGEGA
jgi:small subunit ribosomal protein S6